MFHKRPAPSSKTLATTLKRQLLETTFLYHGRFIAFTACGSSSDNSTHANLADSYSTITLDTIPEDSVQIVVLRSDTDSINFTGSIVKVVYPSNRMAGKDSLTDYSFDCFGSKLEIYVPCNYLRTDYFQYTEAQILTIHYPDSSRITILHGTQADLSIQNNKTRELHNKKVIVKGYQVTYQNVPGQKLQLFNTAFELLKKDIK